MRWAPLHGVDARVDLWGRLSNPVQRRLSPTTVDKLVEDYAEGSSIDLVSSRYEIHRTTVMKHLADRGVQRRRSIRKMTDRQVSQAAARYETGLSLAAVASGFNVHEKTLASEFRNAGVAIRPRNGWPT